MSDKYNSDMKATKKMRRLKCKGQNRNNGLIKKCRFSEEFPDDGFSYNCPICNFPLTKKKNVPQPV